MDEVGAVDFAIGAVRVDGCDLFGPAWAEAVMDGLDAWFVVLAVYSPEAAVEYWNDLPFSERARFAGIFGRWPASDIAEAKMVLVGEDARVAGFEVHARLHWMPRSFRAGFSVDPG